MAAKQEEDRKKLEAELARMREAEAQRIAEQQAEKKKRLGSNFSKIRKSARMIGSANRVVKDLSARGARGARRSGWSSRTTASRRTWSACSRAAR